MASQRELCLVVPGARRQVTGVCYFQLLQAVPLLIAVHPSHQHRYHHRYQHQYDHQHHYQHHPQHLPNPIRLAAAVAAAVVGKVE